jgi:hypothetical protein
MNTGRYILLLAALALLFACMRKPERSVEKPERIIDPDSMVLFVAEAHLIEAALKMNSNPAVETPYYTVLFYSNFFERHGISREEYEANIKYYTSDYDKAQKFYQKVLDHLNALQMEIPPGPPS